MHLDTITKLLDMVSLFNLFEDLHYPESTPQSLTSSYALSKGRLAGLLNYKLFYSQN